MQAWGNAPGKSSPKRALKARIKTVFASIPHMLFAEFDAAFAQKTFEDYASKDNAQHRTSNIEVFPLL
jgi:hypothetical protein